MIISIWFCFCLNLCGSISLFVKKKIKYKTKKKTLVPRRLSVLAFVGAALIFFLRVELLQQNQYVNEPIATNVLVWCINKILHFPWIKRKKTTTRNFTTFCHLKRAKNESERTIVPSLCGASVGWPYVCFVMAWWGENRYIEHQSEKRIRSSHCNNKNPSIKVWFLFTYERNGMEMISEENYLTLIDVEQQKHTHTFAPTQFTERNKNLTIWNRNGYLKWFFI